MLMKLISNFISPQQVNGIIVKMVLHWLGDRNTLRSLFEETLRLFQQFTQTILVNPQVVTPQEIEMIYQLTL